MCAVTGDYGELRRRPAALAPISLCEQQSWGELKNRNLREERGYIDAQPSLYFAIGLDRRLLDAGPAWPHRGSGDRLAQGLKSMSFEQRLTLLLTYQMGYSLEQIAAITDLPAEAVMARMLRARETLRWSDECLGGA